MKYSIKQLKLINGEEILCEVLDEAPDSICVNNALILQSNTAKDGSKFFTFRNFMVYQDQPQNVMLIMSDKIVAIAIPTEDMIEQYEIALEQLASQIAMDHEYGTKLLTEDEDTQTFEEFLREVNDYRLMDSDTDGFTPH
jgi:hypothetical protein